MFFIIKQPDKITRGSQRVFATFLFYSLTFFLLFSVSIFATVSAHNRDQISTEQQEITSVLVAWHLNKTVNVQILDIEQEILAAKQLAIKNNYEVWLYELASLNSALDFLAKVRSQAEVKWAELDTQVSPLTIPEHFKSIGLLDENLGNTAQAPQFSCITYPISVIDSGAQLTHQSLNSIQVEFKKNYLDNNQPDNIQDEYSHGTHVTGLIAAKDTYINSEQSIAGICNPAKISIQKVLAKDGKGKLSDVYAALNDAIRLGPNKMPILNLSLGMIESPLLTDLITELNSQGQILVAAAGNQANNLNAKPAYPASLSQHLPLVISVANFSAAMAKLANNSNYGYLNVDLAAPGTRLLSSGIETGSQEFTIKSGTSMAAPLVSASLSALMEKYINKNLPPAAFKAALINSLTQEVSLLDKITHSGVLNLGRAWLLEDKNLFKPNWFGIRWIKNTQAIEVFGYQLAEVTQVKFKLGILEEELRFSYQPNYSSKAGEDSLIIDLPDNWSLGKLELVLSSRFSSGLASIHLNLAAKEKPANSLPDKMSNFPCSSECSLTWQNTNLRVLPSSGSKNEWWAAEGLYTPQNNSENTSQNKAVPAIIITGKNLNDDWYFNFNTEPGISLNKLYAVNHNGQKVTLTKQQGLQILSENSGQWLVNDAQHWSNLEQEDMQQLVLIPEFSSDRKSSSSGQCFVATSIYADTHSLEVSALRDFRDRVLLTNPAGRWLVKYYYQHSPTWVTWIEDKPLIQASIRYLLNTWVKVWLFFADTKD